MSRTSPVKQISATAKRPPALRHRRSSKEILGRNHYFIDSETGNSVSGPDGRDAVEETELHQNELNVSAGGEFYEKCKARRGRHRKALMDETSGAYQSATALRPSRSHDDIKGPNKAASIFMHRHCSGMLDPENAEEERFKQQAELRLANIRQNLVRTKRNPGCVSTNSRVRPQKRNVIAKPSSSPSRQNVVVDLTYDDVVPIVKRSQSRAGAACSSVSCRNVSGKKHPKRKTEHSKHVVKGRKAFAKLENQPRR